MFGWFKVTSSNAGCDYAAWGSEAMAAAAGSGFVATSYDHVVVVWPGRGCSWAGLAEVNGSRVWVNGEFDVRVVAHELGHNLGLAHAGSLACNGVTLGPSCFGSEYGDPFDVMGGSLSGVRHPSGYHKLRLGCRTPLRLPPITSNGSPYSEPKHEGPSVTPLHASDPACASPEIVPELMGHDPDVELAVDPDARAVGPRQARPRARAARPDHDDVVVARRDEAAARRGRHGLGAPRRRRAATLDATLYQPNTSPPPAAAPASVCWPHSNSPKKPPIVAPAPAMPRTLCV